MTTHVHKQSPERISLRVFATPLCSHPMSTLSSSFAKYTTTTNYANLTIPSIRILCGPEERRELVRLLTGNKEPLLKTLNKHVKHLRTEHCFLLFKEFGKQDSWLQCIELISVMGKKGQTRMAMWLFLEMRNSRCRPDTCVYNPLIADQVNSLFEVLCVSIISPGIYTFNGVMDAFRKNGMIREMESVLARLKSHKCKPDLIFFDLLIDAYGKKQKFDKMEQVFKSLLRSKEKPTLPTFNSMILNYGKARLKEKAGNVFTYESLIYMYGYCDCIFKARDLFEGLIESKSHIKASTLSVMLDVYRICYHWKQILCWRGQLIFKCFLMLQHISFSMVYTKANLKELVDKLLSNLDRDGIIPNKKFFLDALGSSRDKSKSAITAVTHSNSSQDFAEPQLNT